jgi:hypothetical protein
MRHRASRPFIDLWRRLLSTAARPFGALTRVSPIRVAVTLTALLGVGTTAVVTVSSVQDGTSEHPRAAAPDRSGSLTSRGTTRPQLDEQTPAQGDPSKGTESTAPTPHTPDPDEKSSTPGPDRPLKDLPRKDLPDAARTTGGTPTTGPGSTSPEGGTSTPSLSSSPEKRTTASSPSPRDVTAPRTSVSQQVSAGDTAVFTVVANEAASFACSLDGAAFSPCSSPVTYEDLRPGWHTLAVRATDTAGNVDASPAEVRWHANGGPGSSD